MDYIDAANHAQDQNGHGTHVAGIIAAVENNGIGVSGVAPGPRCMPLRVLDSSGSGTIDDVAAAFAYAGQHNIPIVNASLGGPSSSQTLEQAVDPYPGTLYVVAAGNDGTDNDDPGTPFYPCDIPAANLICVGASDQNDQPADFSNYGADERRPVRARGQHPLHVSHRHRDPVRLRRRHLDGHADGLGHARADAVPQPVALGRPAQVRPPGQRRPGAAARRPRR